MIIETKVAKKEQDLEKECDKALQQIVNRKYAKDLYGYEQILCYGIAFFQKRAVAKKLE